MSKFTEYILIPIHFLDLKDAVLNSTTRSLESASVPLLRDSKPAVPIGVVASAIVTAILGILIGVARFQIQSFLTLVLSLFFANDDSVGAIQMKTEGIPLSQGIASALAN
jgi:hypothetical protein